MLIGEGNIGSLSTEYQLASSIYPEEFGDCSKIASCARFSGIRTFERFLSEEIAAKGFATGAVGGPRPLEIDSAVSLPVRQSRRMHGERDDVEGR